MSSPPLYTCWAPADDWRPGCIMLAANVNAIPTPPPQSQPIVGVDGFWGVHEWTLYPQPYRREFPYLPWIALPSPSPSVSSECLTPDLLDELKLKWKSTKAALEGSLKAFSSVPSLSSVERPMKAYARAFETLERLEMEFRAWRDFVEVFRNMQRSLLELCAFLDWWNDVHAGDSHRSPMSYLLIPTTMFALDPAKKVQLSPRKLCKTQPMSLLPLVHSLHHWYYPPFVEDFVVDLETVARGYGERLDDFKPSKMLKRKLDKSKNKANDEAGRRAKKARTSMALQSSNPELRRLTDARAAPVWFPKVQEVWTNAVSHVSHLDLASPTSTRRFALPPIHLFWGGNEKNQQLFYYHFLLLRLEIKHRHTRDVPALTTDEWRTVLNGTYWKLQWPRRDNPSQDTTFDPSVFWKYGGPLFFGDERSVDVAAGRHNPTSALPCGCDVQITSADDSDVRQVALYYLNSFHTIAEIKEMEQPSVPGRVREAMETARPPGRTNGGDVGPFRRT
ncbi:hypothetical protein H4582DRAFT_2079482 [Lactarius indigo]|nr:hypothetical protein H4582DRAFT_2079482 [Lactarius indigo]